MKTFNFIKRLCVFNGAAQTLRHALIKQHWTQREGEKRREREKECGRGKEEGKVVGNCFSVVHLAMQFELQLPADLAAFHTPLPTADSTKRIHTHKMCPAAAEGSGRRSAERGSGRGGAGRRRKLGSVSVCNNFLCASSGFFFG